MALSIDNVVQVDITRQTASVSQQGFGTPLVLSLHTRFPERIKFVASLTEMTDLGFTTSDIGFKMASAIFAQQPKVTQLALGRREANVAGVTKVSFSVNLITGNKVDLKVNGTAIPSVVYATSHAATMTALAAAIALIPGVGSAIASGNDVDVTFALGVSGTISDVVVTLGATQPTSTVTVTTAAKTLESELALVSAESENFYAIVIDSVIEADQLAAAAFAEAHSPSKIFVTRSSQAATLTAALTDIGALLKAKNYDRSVAIYHNIANEFVDAAFVGRMLPFDPGSATAKFKTLKSISADNVTSGEVSNASSKNVNVYTTVGGVDILAEGKVSSGEFFDVIVGLDWLKARIQERVYQVLSVSPKIPYTDAGVSVIENQLRAQLQLAVGQGVLAANPAFTTSVPLVANVPNNDKANRFLPNVNFTGTLAGAIHKVKISGTVSI